MAPRGHPRSQLGGFDKLAQFGVLQHQISGYGRAVRRVPCGYGRVIQSRDGLLHCALDPISADDDVCIKDLSRRESDARPAWDGRVRLYATHSGIDANAHTRGGAREMEEHGMVIPTVDMGIW